MKQAGVEGAEEGLTTLATTMADAFINGNRSEINTMTRQYMQQGLSLKQAQDAATRKWMKGLGLDILGGMISGGVMGSGTIGVNSAVNALDFLTLENRQAAGLRKDNGQILMDGFDAAFEDTTGMKKTAVPLGSDLDRSFEEGFDNAYGEENSQISANKNRSVNRGTTDEEGLLTSGVENDNILFSKNEDFFIGRSLGAKANNHKVRLPNGEEVYLTEGTRVTKVETIAGKGRNRLIDEIDRLIYSYPGTSELEWQKKKGIGFIDYEGESYMVDLHWYEEPTVGRVEWKVKPDKDGNWLYDD